MEIPMAKLTDTQLVILSTALRRDDRGVALPTITGEAVRKAVDKLIRTGLLEEVCAHGSLLAWRRDAEAGPMALRITQRGLESVGIKDDAARAAPETSIGLASHGLEAEPPAAKSAASRKRISAAAQKPTRTKHQPGKAEGKAGSPRKSRPGSKQAHLLPKAAPGSKQSRVIAMLQSPAGATIAAMMKATDWQQHSVRGFLAGVVRKRLKLRLASKKVDGVRVYQIAGMKSRKRRPRKSERPSS
jgi:Protein of unknown function (DUF3489)